MRIIYQHHPLLDSTNTFAKLHASNFDQSAMTVIVAEQQTSGRGRFGNNWLSDSLGSLYTSFVIFVSPEQRYIENSAQAASLAVAHAVNGKIKWPNDVLVNRKKIAGILVETVRCHDKLCLIVGIGLNINTTAEELSTLNKPATSLYIEHGKILDKTEILQQVAQNLAKLFNLLFREGFAAIRQNYLDLLVHASGDHLSIRTHQGSIHAKFKHIDQDGHLVATLENGQLARFASAEIESY